MEQNRASDHFSDVNSFSGLSKSLEIISDISGELFEISEVFLKGSVHFFQIYFGILMNKNISKACYWREIIGKVIRNNSRLAKYINTFLVFLRFSESQFRDHHLGNVYYAFGRKVHVSLHSAP